jgi:hypothetical protein
MFTMMKDKYELGCYDRSKSKPEEKQIQGIVQQGDMILKKYN